MGLNNAISAILIFCGGLVTSIVLFAAENVLGKRCFRDKFCFVPRGPGKKKIPSEESGLDTSNKIKSYEDEWYLSNGVKLEEEEEEEEEEEREKM